VLKEAQYGWVRWNGGGPGAKDLARILRVPGTLNLKYAPPRKVEIVLWQPSTRYDFDRLLEHIPPPPPPPPVRIPTYQVDQNLGIYLAKIIREEYEYVALAPRGQRNTNLNTAAYILGGLVAGGLLDRLDVESSLTAAAMQAGLHEDKDCGMKGIAKTIASGLNRGMTRPRAQPANAFRDVGRDILGHILTARQGDTNNVADAM